MQHADWKLMMRQLLSRHNSQQWARKPSARQSQRCKKTNGPSTFKHTGSRETVAEGGSWVTWTLGRDTFWDQGTRRQQPWDWGQQRSRIYQVITNVRAGQTCYKWRSKEQPGPNHMGVSKIVNRSLPLDFFYLEIPSYLKGSTISWYILFGRNLIIQW